MGGAIDTASTHDRAMGGLLARHEKRALIGIARRLPAAVAPDHLTGLGVAGAALTFASLVASNFVPAALWLALLGLVLNWLGDSLDGTLARARHIERPRYGFYVDHVSDLASQLLIVIGLGLSPFMRLDCALLGLVGYLGLGVLSFVKLHVSRSLQLSYFGVGPTEVRLIIGSGIMMAALLDLPSIITSAGNFALFDVFAVMVLMFACVSGAAGFSHESQLLAAVDPPRHLGPAKVTMTEVSGN